MLVPALVAEGHDVVILSRHAPEAILPSVRHIVCDLGAPDSLAEAAARLVTEGHPVRLLLHCAGVIVPGGITRMAQVDVERQLTVNLAAPMLLTSRLLPLIPRGGHILFINSLAAVFPLADSAVYAASKAGLRSFALALALEMKPRGIAVSSIFPGAVDTPMLRNEMSEGGSVLNFVSPPAQPEEVVRTIMEAVRHPGHERFRPRLDGIFGKLCMMCPPLLRAVLPVLTWFGQRGKDRHFRMPPTGS